MSLRTGEIERVLWRTVLRSLSDPARSVYVALRTGPIATMLDGLIEADVPMLQSVLNRPADYVHGGLEELVQRGVVEFDPEFSLVRIAGIPNAEDPIKSYKQLQGWWANWQQLPPSKLRYRHIPTLKAACDLTVPGKPSTDKYPQPQPSMKDVWDRTFGGVEYTLVDRVSDSPPDRVSGTPPIPATASATASASAPAILNLSGRGAEHPPGGPVDAFPPAPAGAVGGGDGAKEKRVRPKKPKTENPEKPAPPPMPFTIEVLLATLKTAMGEWAIVAPYDRGLSKQLTAVIRNLDEEKCTVEDVRLAGEYLREAVPTWPSAEPIGLSWIATSGKLATAIGKAREWERRGRKLGASQGGPPPQTTVRTGSIPVGDFSQMPSGRFEFPSRKA